MKQIVSLKAEMSLSLQYYPYQILNTVFPHSNRAMLSASLGCSGKLRFKFFKTLAFGALLRLLFGILHCQAI